jgi:hypothetical protein
MAAGSRRFPPPWRADKTPHGYVVRDTNGQALSFIVNLLGAAHEPVSLEARISNSLDFVLPSRRNGRIILCVDRIAVPDGGQLYDGRKPLTDVPSLAFAPVPILAMASLWDRFCRTGVLRRDVDQSAKMIDPHRRK